jgi:hypothetical protein
MGNGEWAIFRGEKGKGERGKGKKKEIFLPQLPLVPPHHASSTPPLLHSPLLY